MFTKDLHNNVGRHCSIRGHEGRNWRVQRAMTGSKYLVRHVTNGEQVVVAHQDMSNLY